MLGESVLNTFQTHDNHDVQVNHHYWSCDRPISGLVTSLFFVWEVTVLVLMVMCLSNGKTDAVLGETIADGKCFQYLTIFVHLVIDEYFC